MTVSTSHEHATSSPAHQPIVREEHELTYFEKRLLAITNLLREKGIITLDEMRRAIEELDGQTPELGARLVVRAWTDPAFKQRLLDDPKAACEELGIETTGINKLVVVENTPDTHNMVVCTLCSCYPRSILGQPPDWYKSQAYRQRAITDPRGVLGEFGLELSPDVEVRVHDSTADVRYLVLPQRPEGTEGMSEADLLALVTRDTMIGVAVPKPRQPA